jgi:hypothetical protein
MNTLRKTLLSACMISLMTAPLASQAEVIIESAQYKPQKGKLFVKGRLSGEAHDQVHVLDADTGNKIGSIDTKARGHMFSAEFDVYFEGAVPCIVKVQTNATRRVRGFFGGAASEGEFATAEVRHSPDRCSE